MMNQERITGCPAVSFRPCRIDWLLVVLTLIVCCTLPAVAASGQFIAHNTPRYVITSKNLGTVNPATVIEVNLWLHPHNPAELDALAARLYNPASADYRHFLNRAQIAARFAPTTAEANTVRQFLTANNLKIVRVGPDNFFVRARGTVGDVQNAFHVLLNSYQVGNLVLRANDRDPYIDGAAGALVKSISGLDSGQYTHPAMTRPSAFGSSKPGPMAASSSAAVSQAQTDFFSNNCFDGTETESFSTNGNGTLPIGTYKGNHLNLQSLTSAGCGYTPPMIQAAYNLTGLYAEKFDGTGQTIGIIDWCGSLTIQNDANVFSAQFGLPALTPANFFISYIPTASTCQATNQTEINIDVEWAHAIAPGANINLIVPPSASFQDVDEAEFTAVTYGIANVISGSYGSPEAFTSTTILETENMISEIAAVSGISTNFSSGDTGDFTSFGIPATVLAPADSPWATAVGGISLALNADNSIAWQVGWGNNEVLLAEAGIVYDPPLAFGLIGGAGGGPSNCVTADANGNCLAGFTKPNYQSKLPGKWRWLPDIGWLADPFTGVVIAISNPAQIPALSWQVWGGTSVACPMFSALWAIANQVAGAPLGLAAPYLYTMPPQTIYDIVPKGSAHNVSASIQEPTTTNKYTPYQALGGTGPGTFISAIWDYPFLQDTSLIISFGSDCSAEPPSTIFGTLCTDNHALKTAVGWDRVTGVGVPNAKPFAEFFKPAATVAPR
jgi:subtilase family serine protease